MRALISVLVILLISLVNISSANDEDEWLRDCNSGNFDTLLLACRTAQSCKYDAIIQCRRLIGQLLVEADQRSCYCDNGCMGAISQANQFVALCNLDQAKRNFDLNEVHEQAVENAKKNTTTTTTTNKGQRCYVKECPKKTLFHFHGKQFRDFDLSEVDQFTDDFHQFEKTGQFEEEDLSEVEAKKKKPTSPKKPTKSTNSSASDCIYVQHIHMLRRKLHVDEAEYERRAELEELAENIKFSHKHFYVQQKF